MIDVKSLRISNLVHYHIFDKFDDPKESVVVNVIDAEDIKYLSENPTNESYTPIPLSEGLLVAAGCVNLAGDTFRTKGGLLFWYNRNDDMAKFAVENKYVWILFVHSFQNFVSACGEELSFDLSLVGAGLGDSLGQPLRGNHTERGVRAH
jgi:hypothetical protein